MAELKIVSLNTREIGQYKKRKTIFNYMKRQEADICLLQETHCVKSCENIWSTQWGSDGVQMAHQKLGAWQYFSKIT